ncbi:HAD family hydrolase [Bacteroidota bacterium]
MKRLSHLFFISISIVVLISCDNLNSDKVNNSDPLPSWNEGNTKSAIIDFVKDITDTESINFIPISDRIATFDNDGNLWSEKPVYFQLYFTIDRIKQLAPEHPEWKTTQPFKAVLEDDMATLAEHGEHGLLELVMATHGGLTTNEFQNEVREWLAQSKHPRFNVPYTELVYQPMLELMDYLRANNFKVFIVSGGGIDFMRAWTDEVYGVPNDQVIGSTLKSEFEFIDGKAEIVKLGEFDFIDDKDGKPIGINRFIGKRPIFASGNSDGDLAMLQYTASGKGNRFMLYLHHTDSIREWAYDRNSSVGRLDKGLDEAREKGWTVIDMKNDWKVVYPFKLEK